MACALREQCAIVRMLEWVPVLRRGRAAALRKEVVAMDPQAVIATCEMLLVAIGIVGLVLVRKGK